MKNCSQAGLIIRDSSYDESGWNRGKARPMGRYGVMHGTDGCEIASEGVIGGRLGQVIQPLNHSVFVILDSLSIRTTVRVDKELTGIWELKDAVIDFVSKADGVINHDMAC